jgi:fused signal recognition particle receptor
MNESSPQSVFYNLIHTLGFQDLTSFILALLFIIGALAFVVSGAVFLIKKHRERKEALLEITTRPEWEKRPEPEPAKEPETTPKPEPEPAKEPETAPKPEPEPAKEPETPPPVSKAEPKTPLLEVVPPEELKTASKQTLKAALKNTRGGFIEKITRLFSSGHELSDADFEAMEAILFTADIGAKTAQKLLDTLKIRLKAQKIHDQEQMKNILKEEIKAIFHSIPAPIHEAIELPQVMLFVGVNGVGKTTSIAKLGAKLLGANKRVIFGAGDTFRAAAVEQLSIWGERLGIPVVCGKEGADSASVLFEAVSRAKREQSDVVLCDTAGRLHTKVELMEELKKVHRVVAKAHPKAPHEVLLVIDATMGQNALFQAREFAQATPLTGVVLSKLDGTAKGGVALGIVDELKVPIRYIGIGEHADDLKEFDADQFVEALFDETSV